MNDKQHFENLESHDVEKRGEARVCSICGLSDSALFQRACSRNSQTDQSDLTETSVNRHQPSNQAGDGDEIKERLERLERESLQRKQRKLKEHQKDLESRESGQTFALVIIPIIFWVIFFNPNYSPAPFR